MKTLKEVWTPEGLTKGIPNGMAQFGEFLKDNTTYPENIKMIEKGKPGVDDQPISVHEGVSIPDANAGIAEALYIPAKHISDIQEKFRKSSTKFANLSSLYKNTKKVWDKQVQKCISENIDPLMDFQKNVLHADKNNTGTYYAAEGKDQNLLGIPQMARLFPSIAGLGAGLGQLGHWAGNSIKYHDTYAENPYQQTALNGLNQLRYNPYPAIRGAYDAERRNTYNIQNAGGLTGAQRYYGMIGNAIANQRGIADIYANSEAQNNALRTQYYNSLLGAGENMAQRRQNAAQHDWADYVAAHGRKTKGIEAGIANIMNAINGGFQNEFKYRMGNKTLGMYLQELNTDRLKALAEYNKSKQV